MALNEHFPRALHMLIERLIYEIWY